MATSSTHRSGPSSSASRTHTYSGKASDNAGNDSVTTTGSVKVDATDPSLAITGCPVGPVILGSVHLINVAAADAESGLVSDPSGSIALETTQVGQRSRTITVNDKVGHEKTGSCSYQVVYDWRGFFRPIDNGDVVNVARAGSSIPVKFSLTGNQGMDIFAAGSPKSVQMNPDASLPSDPIEVLTTSNSGLSYDPQADQYIYVWKTDQAWAGTFRKLTVTLKDGTSHTAMFKLTK